MFLGLRVFFFKIIFIFFKSVFIVSLNILLFFIYKKGFEVFFLVLKGVGFRVFGV